MTPPAAVKLRRFPWLTACLLLLVIGAVARSYYRSDVFGFFTPSGRLQAAGLDRGRVYLFISNVPFGAERALTTRLL